MPKPGEYVPDPSEGITAVEDLPKPQIVRRSRTYRRRRCPRCGRGAYRLRHVKRRLHDLGDHETEARTYHRAGDFLALKDLIENLLRTYHSRSPYINLDEWVNGVGTACYECGEHYSDEDLVLKQACSLMQVRADA